MTQSSMTAAQINFDGKLVTVEIPTILMDMYQRAIGMAKDINDYMRIVRRYESAIHRIGTRRVLAGYVV